jgi:hypothetical protein
MRACLVHSWKIILFWRLLGEGCELSEQGGIKGEGALSTFDPSFYTPLPPCSTVYDSTVWCTLQAGVSKNPKNNFSRYFSFDNISEF